MKLALYGGEKTKQTPFGTGNRFGEEELHQLQEALEQNTLFYWSGEKVKTFAKKFADMYSMPYCTTTSSGTAALHTALGAAGVSEGDEVITSPITDMGTIIGILLQNAIPVFADLDENNYNLTAETIKEKISDKTKAVVVVHLAGSPADMDPIMELCRANNIKVIEDCAQSYLTTYKGKLCGTIGDFGCFSLNDYKHISAGDGGMVLTHNEEDYKTSFRFADKNYNRFESGRTSDIPYVAPNYRMNELTGAVAIAQLDKLKFICDTRRAHGDRMTQAFKDIPGVMPPKVLENCTSSYWFYMLRIAPDILGCTAAELAEAMCAEGIPCGKGYLPECVYEYTLFKTKSAYKGTNAPFDSPYYGKEINYDTGLCPVAEKILTTSVMLPINEFHTDEDVDDVIKAFKKVTSYFLSQNK